MTQQPTDEILVQRIQTGDRTAFRQLFDRYYRELLGTAVNLLRDESRGKDVVQDVFLQIWNNRASWNLRGNAGPYLKRAVINRSLNALRQAKREVGEEALHGAPTHDSSPAEHLSFSDLNQALEAALMALPERCRTIFILKRLDGLSQKEIAAQLDISTKTVENQITKAVKALKTALQQYQRDQMDGT